MKSDRKLSIKCAFLYISLLSSLIYCISYVHEVSARAWLFNASYDNKQAYVEKTFKYLPVYDTAKTIINKLPLGEDLSLYDDHSNYMYHYSRLNYFLYPKYISADVKTVARINDGDSSALKQIKLGNNVVAIDLKSPVYTRGKEKPFVYIANIKYTVISKADNNSYILKRGR